LAFSLTHAIATWIQLYPHNAPDVSAKTSGPKAMGVTNLSGTKQASLLQRIMHFVIASEARQSQLLGDLRLPQSLRSFAMTLWLAIDLKRSMQKIQIACQKI
jgi:hypothetical protein